MAARSAALRRRLSSGQVGMANWVVAWFAALALAACSKSTVGPDASQIADAGPFDTKHLDSAVDAPEVVADGHDQPDASAAEVDAAFDGDADTPPVDIASATDGEQLIVIDAAGSATPIDCVGCKWEKIGPMAQHRINFGAAWSGEHLYVFGGQTAFFDYQNDPDAWPPFSNGMTAVAERWDSKTNTWEVLPKPPMWPQDHTRMVWGGDRLYVAPNAGFGWAKGWTPLQEGVVAYVPAQKKWEALPTENGPGVRGGPGLVWTGKRLLVLGAGAKSTVHAAHAYDPAKAKWEILPKPPLNPNYSPICGGWTGTAYMMWTGSFDPVAFKYTFPIGLIWREAEGKWEKFAAPPGLPESTLSLEESRNCAGVLGGLFIWARTGKSMPQPHSGWLRRADSPTWEHIPLPAWVSPPIHSTHLGWAGQYIVIWSGETGMGGKFGDTGLLYDPVAHLWRRLPKTDAPIARTYAGVASTPGAFFVVGGLDGLNPNDNTWFLDGGRLSIPP